MPESSGSAKAFHPVLFAAFPVLSLYSLNTGIIPASDVVRPLLVSVGSAILVWCLAALVLKNWAKAAAVASIVILGFFTYGHATTLVPYDSSWVIDTGIFNVIWATVLVALVIVLGVKRWPEQPVSRGLNVAGIVLVVLPLATLLGAVTTSYAVARKGPVSSPNASAKPINPASASALPDIFYVVLDGFGRSDALRSAIGFDDSEFLNGLKDRGFYVADRARSNYCQTELSLASSLNMDYLPSLIPNLDRKSSDRSEVDAMIDRSRVSERLRAAGYQYVAIKTGFPALRFESADIRLGIPGKYNLFETELLSKTPFRLSTGQVRSMYDSRRLQIKGAFANLGRLGKRNIRPKFVIAHVLAPHPPFVFGPNGEELRPKGPFSLVDGSHFMENGGTAEQYATGFAGQAKTIGRLTLEAIDEIKRQSKVPPIILIQGDHGSKLHLDQENLEKTDLNEVFPILNAYFVPEDLMPEIDAGITPVNTFRVLFSRLFGDDLPRLQDRSFYSPWSFPFDFTDVTDRIE